MSVLMFFVCLFFLWQINKLKLNWNLKGIIYVMRMKLSFLSAKSFCMSEAILTERSRFSRQFWPPLQWLCTPLWIIFAVFHQNFCCYSVIKFRDFWKSVILFTIESVSYHVISLRASFPDFCIKKLVLTSIA